MRLAVLAATVATAASLPQNGAVVPGQSLGGLRLGMTPAQVRTLWGSSHGLCRDCRATTWYFNYRPFTQEGAAVEFRRGRVSALWTIWEAEGWHTNRGLTVGDAEAEISTAYGILTTSHCSGYDAQMIPTKRVVTSFYVVDGKVWGFGLTRPGARVCH